MPSFLDRLRIRHAKFVVIKKTKKISKLLCIATVVIRQLGMKKEKIPNLAANEGIFSHVKLQNYRYIVCMNSRRGAQFAPLQCKRKKGDCLE